jgi:dihydroneopterin aldolase
MDDACVSPSWRSQAGLPPALNEYNGRQTATIQPFTIWAQMDTIFIRELRLPAWIGLYKHEKIAPQLVEIDIEMALPTDAVFQTHKVRDTIDYGVVCEKIRKMLSGERFGLVESLAARIAQIVIDDFKSPNVIVSITKLGVLKDAKRVGVRIERSRPDE